MKLDHVQFTHVGLVRSVNQDALLCLREQGLFLVADGMGGEQAGEEASAQVVKTLGETGESLGKEPPSSPTQLETKLSEGFQKANKDVIQISVADPRKTGMGSTASLLYLYRGLYFIAHVGDSRIYLARNGNVNLLTHDHSLVWVLYEQGALTRSQMDSHPDRNLLTQSIGSTRGINVDTAQNHAKEGDLFLACSDGLTSYVSEEKVFSILSRPDESLQATGEALIQAALDAGGGDNVSIILVRVLEMEPHDDWESEETAPVGIARHTDGALIDSETGLPTTLGGGAADFRSRKGIRRYLKWPIIVPGLLMIIVPGLLLARHNSVILHLKFPDQQVSTDVEVKGDDGSSFNPSVLTGKEGPYLKLRRQKQYHLLVRREGCADFEQTLAVPWSERSMEVAVDWAPLAKLTLGLPTEHQVTSLSVSAEKASGKNHVLGPWRDQDLAGKKNIEVSLQPNVVYEIIARTAKGETFNKRVDLPPRGDRTIRIFFPVSGEQTQ